MANRSTESMITFKHPFAIGTPATQLEAGSYRLTVEEEMIEGLSFAAYKRTSTSLEIPAVGVRSNSKQYLQIVPEDLEAALVKDAGKPVVGEPTRSLYSRDSLMARARDLRGSRSE